MVNPSGMQGSGQGNHIFIKYTCPARSETCDRHNYSSSAYREQGDISSNSHGDRSMFRFGDEIDFGQLSRQQMI